MGWNGMGWDIGCKNCNPKRSNRARGKKNRSMFIRCVHYQPEYNVKDREVQDQFGATAAQITYFARKLRESDMGPSNAVTYRVFVDRRWDNLTGIVCAKRWYNVSYTATVKSSHRFHVIKKLKPYITKSKVRKHRGKYRTATTTVQMDGEPITLTEVLWNDSSLVGCVSADLGSAEHRVTRRMGRHTPTVAQPDMMHERDKHYRAVDQNDQLRLGKWKFQHTAKRVCWHKLFFALIEILLVNIFLVAQQTEPELLQDDFRWAILLQLVAQAEELERDTPVSNRTRSQQPDIDLTGARAEQAVVTRWEGGLKAHHHAVINDYVTKEEAARNQKIVDNDPPKTMSRKTMRRRDQQRQDGKVRNPFYTSTSLCLVCKFTKKDVNGLPVKTWTTKYCLECMPQPDWPKTNRATGFQRRLHLF